MIKCLLKSIILLIELRFVIILPTINSRTVTFDYSLEAVITIQILRKEFYCKKY